MTMEYLCANFKEVLKTLGLKEEYIESPTFSIVAEELRKKLFSEKKDLNGYFATKKYSEEINPSDIKVEYKEENGQVKIELIGQSSYYSSRQEFNATLSYDIYSKTITYSEFMLGYENYMKNDLVESNLIFQYDNNGNVIYTNLSGKTSNYLKEDGGLYHHTTANEEITTILSNGLEFKKEINYCSNPEYNNGSLNRVFPTASSIMEHFEKPIGRSDSRTIMTRETFDVMSVKYITSDFKTSGKLYKTQSFPSNFPTYPLT